MNTIWTSDPFSVATQQLIGGPDWQEGARLILKPVLSKVVGWPHTTEYLRQMIMGDRKVTPLAMECLAPVLRIKPSFWIEYRLYQISNAFSRHPEMHHVYYEEIIKLGAHLTKKKGRTADSQAKELG